MTGGLQDPHRALQTICHEFISVGDPWKLPPIQISDTIERIWLIKRLVQSQSSKAKTISVSPIKKQEEIETTLCVFEWHRQSHSNLWDLVPLSMRWLCHFLTLRKGRVHHMSFGVRKPSSLLCPRTAQQIDRQPQTNSRGALLLRPSDIRLALVQREAFSAWQL